MAPPARPDPAPPGSRRAVLAGLGALAGAGLLGLLSPGRGTDPAPPDPLAPAEGLAARTDGFARLAAERPWVERLGRCCGLVITRRPGVEGRGSCVLLDRFGTLALTAHQVEDWLVEAGPGRVAVEGEVRFAPTPGPLVVSGRLEQVRVAGALDLAFATLDLAPLAGAGLAPVAWGSLPAGLAGVELVAAGWPHGHERLHAAAGRAQLFRDYDQETYTSLGHAGADGRFLCKAMARIDAHPGMSGGGVFLDGAFVGIDNANGPADDIPDLRFTPVWAVWDAYRKLYPDRAATVAFAGPLRPDQTAMPLSCRGEPEIFFPAP